MTESGEDTTERNELDDWIEDIDRRNFELDCSDDEDNNDESRGNFSMDGDAIDPFAEDDETGGGDD